MPEDENDDAPRGDSDRRFSQDQVNRMIADRLSRDRDRRSPQQPAQMTAENIAAIVSTAVSNAMAAQQPTAPATPAAAPMPPPAVAERAPSKVDPITSNGLVNVFSMTPGQIDQLGHVQFREHFEKILEYAKSQSGAPPKPGTSRKR